MKIKKKNILFFLVIALCKFGHRKLDIRKTVTARSFKLAQLIEDNNAAAQMTPLHAHADEFSVTRGLNLGLHPSAVLKCDKYKNLMC